MKGINESELRSEIAQFAKRYDTKAVRTEEFNTFKEYFLPVHFTLYEKLCNLAERIVPISPDPKNSLQIRKDLESCHINASPTGVTSFSLIFPVFFILAGVMLSLLITMFLTGGRGFMFFVASFFIMGVMIINPLSTFPSVLAQGYRLKASNQMVLSIFYIVSFMRHTSNLELALKFTSDHISPPLSLDFRKILWDVETAKYSSVQESLDAYLANWQEYAPSYVESMHLVISSLFETGEKKRIDTLEKSMSLILESTYENMLHYAQNLSGPINMLHMLGVILPILGLVILPLVVSFLGVEWYNISVLYNIFLPIIVWYLGKNILSTRPTGYGQADITEVNPELNRFTYVQMSLNGKERLIDPKWFALLIGLCVLLVGLSPIIIHAASSDGNSYFDIVYMKEKVMTVNNMKAIDTADYSFLGYKFDKTGKKILGPYGLGATLISIFIPLSLVLALGYYYTAKTRKLAEIRDRTKKLDDEFASALFQLGNRMGDGLPPEIAFSKVAETMKGTHSGEFFELASNNISVLGMGIEEALFHKKFGAIRKYPSALIESSMKVFIESSKKGPEIASNALINISTYIKEMHRVDERLRDLMAETTSSMTSQINFLAPLISGIVIGLTSMITLILNKLTVQMSSLSQSGSNGSLGAQAGMLDMFGDSIPTFYFQIVIGIYVVQITYILTTMLNTLQNGYDPLNEKRLLAMYINKSGIMYAIVSTIVIILFNMIAAKVLSGMNFMNV